jgi:hypothetical protein
MKKLAIALLATASLSIGACSVSDQDAVNNAEMNQPAADDLNAMSLDASNDAASAEAEALGTQQQQLEQAPVESNNTTQPTDEDEQNVSGM